MSALTREDLKTILLFGIHVAKIDEEFAVWERQVLSRFADAMHLSEAEREEMAERDISLAEGLRRLSGQEAATLLVKTLCAVAASDGKDDPVEREFIHKVVERLDTSMFLLPRAEWASYEQEVLEALRGLEAE